MDKKGYIKFATHAVQINQDEDGKIYCFKYSKRNGDPICALESFQNQEDAVEYILEPFPTEWVEMI